MASRASSISATKPTSQKVPPRKPSALRACESQVAIKPKLTRKHSGLLLDQAGTSAVKNVTPSAKDKEPAEAKVTVRWRSASGQKIVLRQPAVRSVDRITPLTDNLELVDPRLRRVVDAEIRRSMSSSALERFPKVLEANDSIPGLTKESARLLYAVLQRVLENPEAQAAIRASGSSERSEMPDASNYKDPKTGLYLLPVITERFKDRVRRSEKPEEFLMRTDWAPLARRHLVYSEHLRRTDMQLYYAFDNRARSLGVRLNDFLFQNGILAKEFISHPPKGFEYQAELLRAVRLFIRAQSLGKSADRSLAKSR